jgi:hypothetical protein
LIQLYDRKIVPQNSGMQGQKTVAAFQILTKNNRAAGASTI